MGADARLGLQRPGDDESVENQHGLDGFAGYARFCCFVDLCARESVDQALEGGTAFDVHLQQARDESLGVGIALLQLVPECGLYQRDGCASAGNGDLHNLA
ncbi:MAG: hypothetical protein L0H29_00860 [Sinobacteraceae bacterium]|nr:hypothetical protein [Nevskiaceae bacterium]